MINIAIGEFQMSCRFFETDAPRDFDGFGTFTVFPETTNSSGFRTVGIMIGHQNWQQLRYSSGRHSVLAVDDDRQKECVAELAARVIGQVSK